MPRGYVARLTLIVALMLGPVLTANAHEEDAPTKSSKVSVSAGFDVTTAYFFRGIGQENQGFIIQPWADIGFALYEGDGAINSLAMNVGVWESFHDEQTFASTSSDSDSWYEADFYIGITVGLLDKWETSLTYTWLASPNDAFSTVEEITWAISYDDSECWKDVKIPGFEGLSPTVTFVFETDNQADVGSNEGVYLGLGIEPSFTVVESVDSPITLSLPMLLVFDLDDYYESPVDGSTDGFAYADLGAVLSMPLAFIPSDYGTWTGSLGVHVLLLNDSLEDLSAGNGTSGDSTEVIGTFSVGVEF